MTPRRPYPIWLALMLVLAALSAPGASAAGAPVRAWLTTGDKASLLPEQPATALGARLARPTSACATSRSPTIGPRSCRCCGMARALNPALKVMATPWSPPAWMKTNDSLVGGRFKDDPLRPGAVRIGSTVAGNAWNVAVHNPDGSIVVVVVNDDWGTTAQQFNVSGAGQPFSYTLPAGAVATFVLR